MQKQFLGGSAPIAPDLPEAVEITNYVAGLFRDAGRPVLWVQDREGIELHDPGFALIDALHVAPGDARIVKTASNAFREPDLERQLAASSTDFVLFAGFKAEGCVLATAKGAEDRDLPHALLRSAVVSTTPDAPAFIERICPLVSYEVVAAIVSG